MTMAKSDSKPAKKKSDSAPKKTYPLIGQKNKRNQAALEAAGMVAPSKKSKGKK